MPELPEVETIKRDLRQKILNCIIEDVFIYDSRVIKNSTSKAFVKSIKGGKVIAVSRKAKALVIKFSNSFYLIVQLGMTGHLIYGTDFRKNNITKETKLTFKLSQGQYLNYNDHRLFGKLQVVKDLNQVGYFKNIGPDALHGSFDSDWLAKSLKERKAPIKTLLMNQNFLGGIGNIYASEILFAARINPKRRAQRLTRQEIQSLHQSTIHVLREAVQCRGTSMRDYLDTDGQKGEFLNRIKVYGRAGEPCRVCRGVIQRFIQSGRSTFFCRKCQQ